MKKLGRALVMAVMASCLLAVPVSAATRATSSDATKATSSDATVKDYLESDILIDEVYTGVSKNTTVTCEQSASFSVIIPKEITLNGAKGARNSADYTVTVRGDIPGTQTIKVVPDTAFKMGTTGKPDINASVTQTKKNFSVALDSMASLMTGVSTTGTVEVQNLSSGVWNGAFNFNISVSEGGIL